MPWKECHVMDERLRFVARLLEGEKMAPLCASSASHARRLQGVRPVQGLRVQAFSDRSRRGASAGQSAPAPIEAVIVRLKREYPGWGAPKIREKLRQQFTGPTSRRSARHAVLDRHGWCIAAGAGATRHGHRALRPAEPNALWCADYKGEFLLGNRRYCYPLTVTDFASRYLLTCEALATTRSGSLHRLRAHVPGVWAPAGHPDDNGVPFARRMRSTGSASSRLVARLGFRSSASTPDSRNRTAATSGCISPEAGATAAAANVLQQQARFDASSSATTGAAASGLGMKVPATSTAVPASIRGWRAHLPVSRLDDRRDQCGGSF